MHHHTGDGPENRSHHLDREVAQVKVYIILEEDAEPDEPIIFGVWADLVTAQEVAKNLNEGTPFAEHSYEVTVHHVQ